MAKSRKSVTLTTTTSNGIEVELMPVLVPDGTRYAVLADGLASVRVPFLNEATERCTNAGSVVWVNSIESRVIRNLDRRLANGSLALVDASEGAIIESVVTGGSVLKKKALRRLLKERRGLRAAALARSEERKAAKAERKSSKSRKTSAAPKAAPVFTGKGSKKANKAFANLSPAEKRAVTGIRNRMDTIPASVARMLVLEASAVADEG